MDVFTESEHLAEPRYRKLLQEQPGFVWRRFEDGEELKAYAFFPKDHKPEDSAASVLFFHGGMWVSDAVGDFVPWALHLAQMGVVGIIPMFRTKKEYEVTPADNMVEAREAWAWVYENAAQLGLDPERITVAGSDAGGLMALHVALPDKPQRWSIFRKKAPKPPGPAAVALFRGVCDLSASSTFKLANALDDEQREAFNPFKRLQKGIPPLFICHGGRDRLLPWHASARLAQVWKKKKAPVHFNLLEIADHNFYHFNVNATFFEQLMSSWTAFMADLGIWDIDDAQDSVLLR